MRRIVLFCFFIHSFFLVAQTRILTGVVADSLQAPLENANIIAKPLVENAQLRFAISDYKGRFRLELDKNTPYEIQISYLGYKDQTLTLQPDNPLKEHNFYLQSSGEQLDEITLTHEFKPITVKKDTLTYNVSSFASGNERKMKDILEKLPGVEVDKQGGVTFQGRKINKLLVENKPFFGGGTKLAVENIPADALDKIEIIDDYNEVAILKNVNDSDQLAMNVKLKEDKKKFVFGDLEAGAGNEGHYLANAALFYYSPKTNVSFIGNTNDVARETFSFSDFMRFEGGISRLLESGRGFSSGLSSFLRNNTEVTENKSDFAAVNISHDLNSKVALSGYGIFSNRLMRNRSATFNQFLLDTGTQIENRLERGKTNNTLGMGKFRVDYSPNRDSKWYYDLNVKASDNSDERLLDIFDGASTTLFDTDRNADNFELKQYAEWHRSIDPNHTTSLVVSHGYNRETPRNNWITNQPFLPGLIPLQPDDPIIVEQIKKKTANNFDALFKYYWIVNPNNHIYAIAGNTYSEERLLTSEKQLLSDDSVNDFADNGFGNETALRFNDFYTGLEYKFRFGISTHKASMFVHYYNWDVDQLNTKTTENIRFQPEWYSEIEFNNSEKLTFRYKLNNRLPDVQDFTKNFTLQSYNLVSRGNPFLNMERFHTSSLFYNKTSVYKGLMIFSNLTYNRKIRSLRNQIGQTGINRFTTPFLTDNPENNWNFTARISKILYKFTLLFEPRWSHSDYFQDVNGLNSKNTNINTSMGGSVKTNFKKFPTLKAGFRKNWNSFSSAQNLSRFENEAFEAELNYEFIENWTLRADYSNNTNRNVISDQTFRFETGNASLTYQNKKSPWGFEFNVTNFLNNPTKSNNSFSEILSSEQTIFILPRIYLFTVKYKL